jgi:hypothetical protein
VLHVSRRVLVLDPESEMFYQSGASPAVNGGGLRRWLSQVIVDRSPD